MDTTTDGPGDPGTPDGDAGRTGRDGSVPYLPPRRSGDVPPPRRNRGWWVALGAVVVLALAVFVLWPLFSAQQSPRGGGPESPAPSVSRNEDPGLDGIVARQVPPVQVQPGDCLTDFSSLHEPSTVVECDREHVAQLVGRKTWPAHRDFPADMAAQAEEFCGTVQLRSTQDAQVVLEISHPTEGTWNEGDRRVDCVAVAHDGVLTDSLVDEPTTYYFPDSPATPSAPASS